jgi:hypothetical protein
VNRKLSYGRILFVEFSLTPAFYFGL